MATKPWLFFFPKIPLLSTIPNLPHSFSVHLMNCYFQNFWYSRVTEKNTIRREKCNMRKKQDIIWERSTLWESVESWVIRYLKKNHPKYREMQTQEIKLVENNPALWKLMNESKGVTLTQEDHKVLHKYPKIKYYIS